jgi:hypothetical protein
MKKITIVASSLFLLYSTVVKAQAVKFSKSNLQPVQVSMAIEHFEGKQVVKVRKDTSVKAVDQPTFVRVSGIEFKEGTIEVNVLSRLLPNAPALARGFIGIAFRINDDNSKFECIYVRPANGRADNQLQRNHSIQYFSYPDYDFERLRKEATGVYETYADMGLNEWIKLKIVVEGTQTNLYLNSNRQPSLIVKDLKHGANLSGAIGLWVDVGTEGIFTDLKISKE